MGSLLAAAAPVLLHYVGQMADGVEDVTSLLPLSVTQTKTVIDRAWEAASLELAIAVWAMARRRLAPADMGAGPRRVYELLLPLLHIGDEGRRIFNMRQIVGAVRDGDLVNQCMSSGSPE
jgi:histidine ammonia-lyase